jgi:hypothetical protein
VNVAATGARELTLGRGRSRWTRVAVTAGGRGRWGAGPLQLELEAGPAAALTVAWGDGHDVNTRDTALTFGLAAGGRLALPLRSLRLWADARGLGWLRRQRVRNQSPAPGEAMLQELPALEAQLTLGASYVFR